MVVLRTRTRIEDPRIRCSWDRVELGDPAGGGTTWIGKCSISCMNGEAPTARSLHCGRDRLIIHFMALEVTNQHLRRDTFNLGRVGIALYNGHRRRTALIW
jgi:hypothetical protein